MLVQYCIDHVSSAFEELPFPACIGCILTNNVRPTYRPYNISVSNTTHYSLDYKFVKEILFFIDIKFLRENLKILLRDVNDQKKVLKEEGITVDGTHYGVEFVGKIQYLFRVQTCFKCFSTELPRFMLALQTDLHNYNYC